MYWCGSVRSSRSTRVNGQLAHLEVDDRDLAAGGGARGAADRPQAHDDLSWRCDQAQTPGMRVPHPGQQPPLSSFLRTEKPQRSITRRLHLGQIVSSPVVPGTLPT
jgi:hypothetical protein